MEVVLAEDEPTEAGVREAQMWSAAPHAPRLGARAGRHVVPLEPFAIADRGSFLLVEFFGTFSIQAGKQCVDKMAEASLELGRPKVLLDCRRMLGDLSVIARFQVAEYGATKSHQLRQLALVGSKDAVLPDRFAESVAVNRGMNMKVFTDFDEAVLWLTRPAANEAEARDG